jgi:hypothetical protein
VTAPSPGNSCSWWRRAWFRWKPRQCTAVGPSALAHGRVWVHRRGGIRVGAATALDGHGAPIEIHSDVGARVYNGRGALIESGGSLEAQSEGLIGPSARIGRVVKIIDSNSSSAGTLRLVPGSAPDGGDRPQRHCRHGRSGDAVSQDRARRSPSRRNLDFAACPCGSRLPAHSAAPRCGTETDCGSRRPALTRSGAFVEGRRRRGDPARVDALPRLPVLSVGDGWMVAAGSAVMQDVPPNSLPIGNLARCMSIDVVAPSGGGRRVLGLG